MLLSPPWSILRGMARGPLWRARFLLGLAVAVQPHSLADASLEMRCDGRDLGARGGGRGGDHCGTHLVAVGIDWTVC